MPHPHSPDSSCGDTPLGSPGSSPADFLPEAASLIQTDAFLWHSRGYLPHAEAPLLIQHVTFHLADSLPAEACARIEEEVGAIPMGRREAMRRRRYQDYVDAGHGCCLLRDPAAAGLAQSALLFFDAQRYRLLAWAIMPNHVHVLLQPLAEWTLARIAASWKSFTGRRLSALLSEPTHPDEARRVWHREYWDRYIRSARHFEVAKQYIHANPVKAGLVANPADWPWSSARYTQEGDE
ncbi:MAG: REP-associated tyrosine transposase [Anaerolineae bacterium]